MFITYRKKQKLQIRVQDMFRNKNENCLEIKM